MRAYAREQILENYGVEALKKVEEYMKDSNAVTDLLVYAEYDVFEIFGGILANHSLNVDDALYLLDVDMDAFAEEQGWDGWNYEALDLIDVE